jgi:hypothetical protein
MLSTLLSPHFGHSQSKRKGKGKAGMISNRVMYQLFAVIESAETFANASLLFPIIGHRETQ